MSTVTEQSKLQGESITLNVSFLSRLEVGESVWSAAADVAVLVGEDEDTAAMMPNPPIVIGSYDVTLGITGGTVGNIYQVTIAIRSTMNNIYYNQVKVAVLPGSIAAPDPL